MVKLKIEACSKVLEILKPYIFDQKKSSTGMVYHLFRNLPAEKLLEIAKVFEEHGIEMDLKFLCLIKKAKENPNATFKGFYERSRRFRVNTLAVKVGDDWFDYHW